ncbi:hypothetical protein E8E14_014858 [Neopestalotiopsis sp. 37M]|nr:hypothetical protein E8E14_014858 [Neopestalotiopsis sp. 37M]
MIRRRESLVGSHLGVIARMGAAAFDTHWQLDTPQELQTSARRGALDLVPPNILTRICEAALQPSINFVSLADLSLCEDEPEYIFRPSSDNWHAKKSAYHYKAAIAKSDEHFGAVIQSLIAARSDYPAAPAAGWAEAILNLPFTSTGDLYCIRADLSLKRPDVFHRAAAINSWYLSRVLYAGIEYSKNPQQLPGAALGVSQQRGKDPVRARQEAAEIIFWMLRKIPARKLYVIVPPEVWSDGHCDIPSARQAIKESLRTSGTPKLFEGRSYSYYAATRDVLRCAQVGEVHDVARKLRRLSSQSGAPPVWNVGILIGIPS